MYHEVHQAWSVILPQKQTTLSKSTSTEKETISQEKTRHLVQLTRIKKRMNILTLAKSIGTTPDALSSYEAGSDILNIEILNKLLKILEIEST